MISFTTEPTSMPYNNPVAWSWIQQTVKSCAVASFSEGKGLVKLLLINLKKEKNTTILTGDIK